METLWPAIAEIAIGLAFCFFGYPAARFVLALWGAVLGFILGVAGYAIVVGWLGSNLGTVAPWIAGAVGAVVVAGLSFAFYWVSVLVAMGSLGWGLGQVLASSLHVAPWLAVTIAVVVAVGLVIVGWTLDLPRLLLIIATAFIGAGVIVDGIQLLLGHSTRWYENIGPNFNVGTDLVWPISFAALGIIGALVQSRQHGKKTLRAAYQ
ncbi:MAG TPA: DUF4203 domain-containing protein [Propionicimonas sp.]|nr:DUF4203 domain-containing protein [Propionicimonas sp.]HRA06865.1 DUF4203 domain-containing protein [Propionicimonas sp.]